jgi:hypothetical protein
MAYNDNFNPADNMDYTVSSQEFNKMALSIKKSDRGYNVIWRMVTKDEILKRTKIEVYTSSGFGCHIRDAETGDYYAHTVGSADEYLYFSVILATGECTSANGSSTLFYLSPQHCMTHLKCELKPSVIAKWVENRDMMLRQMHISKKENVTSVVVK